MRHMPFYDEWKRETGGAQEYTQWLRNRERQIQSGSLNPDSLPPESVHGRGLAGQTYLGPQPQLTPDQARNIDIARGMGRWRTEVQRDPRYRDIMIRSGDMSHGLNAQEMQAAREQMQRGLQSQQQNAMRQLYSQQARSRVRGGMAGAQQMRLQRQAGQDRNAAEQALLLKNYDLKRQGLTDYSDRVNRDIAGLMGTGFAEAGLGVADRGGAQQLAIARAMQQASNQRSGLFGWGIGPF